MTLTARATTYNGIKMRSRLEATVAAHFDRWGYDWRYEARAFASPAGQYLPDFELWIGDQLKTIVEVRGNEPDWDAAMTRMEIVWASEPDAFLLLIDAASIQDGWAHERGWPAAVMPFRNPAHPTDMLPAAFVLCACGTVGLRLIGPGFHALACRGCLSSDAPVAYLNPTEYRG